MHMNWGGGSGNIISGAKLCFSPQHVGNSATLTYLGIDSMYRLRIDHVLS